MEWTLWLAGADGHYISCSSPSRVSPVYTTVDVARDLIRDGIHVDLPDGYTSEVLDQIAWRTGAYDQQVRIDPRQARELVQLAHTLVAHHAAQIPPAELSSIHEIFRIITPRTPEEKREN